MSKPAKIKSGNWADSDDEEDVMPSPLIRSNEQAAVAQMQSLTLGATASSASSSGGEKPKEPLVFPTEPPFRVQCNNLKYEFSEEELANVFAPKCKIAQITKVFFRNQPNGQAVVDFEDLESMKNAFEYEGHDLLGRPIKLQVGTGNKNEEGRNRGGRGGMQQHRGGNNDRRGSQDSRQSGSNDGNNDRGRFGSFNGNTFANKNRYNNNDRQGGDGKDRDNRDDRRNRRVSSRDGGEGFQSYEKRPSRDEGQGKGQDGYRERPRTSQGDRGDASSAPASASEPTKERPKLNLMSAAEAKAKRETEAVSRLSQTSDNKADPFQGALPREEVLRRKRSENSEGETKCESSVNVSSPPGSPSMRGKVPPRRGRRSLDSGRPLSAQVSPVQESGSGSGSGSNGGNIAHGQDGSRRESNQTKTYTNPKLNKDNINNREGSRYNNRNNNNNNYNNNNNNRSNNNREADKKDEKVAGQQAPANPFSLLGDNDE